MQVNLNILMYPLFLFLIFVYLYFHSSTEINQLKFDIVNLNSSSLWFTEQNDNGESLIAYTTGYSIQIQ